MSDPESVADVLGDGIRLADQLEAAHRSGRLHRALTPASVTRDAQGTPVLGGFADVAASGPWSPPEVVDGRSSGSVAGDVYGLGAVLWTWLAGQPPFAGDDASPRAVEARILHSAPSRIGRDGVPPELEALLGECLAKDPGRRPDSAAALAERLRGVESGLGLEPTPLDLPVDDGVAEATPGVVSESVSERAAPSGARPAAVGDPPSRGGRRTTPAGWWAVAGVVLVVIVGIVVWRAATAGSSGAAPGVSAPTPSGTPGVAGRPVVTAHRDGDQVEFRWRPSDTPQPGDSYRWQVVGRPGDQLTNGTTTTVHSAARVCLRVRLSRSGVPPSAWGSACG